MGKLGGGNHGSLESFRFGISFDDLLLQFIERSVEDMSSQVLLLLFLLSLFFNILFLFIIIIIIIIAIVHFILISILICNMIIIVL